MQIESISFANTIPVTWSEMWSKFILIMISNDWRWNLLKPSKWVETTCRTFYSSPEYFIILIKAWIIGTCYLPTLKSLKKEPESWQGYCWKTGQTTGPILRAAFCVTVTAVFHTFTSLLSHPPVTPVLLHMLEHISLFSPILLPPVSASATGRKQLEGWQEAGGLLKQERKFAKIMGGRESRESWLILRIQGLMHWQKDVSLPAKETHPAVRQVSFKSCKICLDADHLPLTY